MTGQELFSDVHYDCWREEPAHIRAIQTSHEPEFGYSDLSHSKIEKGNAEFPVHPGDAPDENSIKAGFDEETKKRACYLSLVSALDKNPDTKYKA